MVEVAARLKVHPELRRGIEQLRQPHFWTDFYDHVQDQLRRITHLLIDLSSASESSSGLFRVAASEFGPARDACLDC